MTVAPVIDSAWKDNHC